MRCQRFTWMIVFVWLATMVYGQDFHYTQYFHSPLGVNPALTGAFYGSYRINGIYRDQYRGSAYKPFSGFSINVDAPIIRGLRKQDWVGVGLRMEQNKAGALGQKLNYYAMGASYHYSLDKKQTSILSLGAQYGTGGYSYDIPPDDAFASQITGNPSEQATSFGTPSGGGGSSNPSIKGGDLNDLAVGLLYNLRNPKTGGDIKLGFAVEGILNPNRGRRAQDRKGIGLNIFGAMETVFTRRLSLSSGAYFYSNKKANALIVNGIVNYKMKPKNDLTLHAGLGARNLRAALVFLGLTIKGIRAGLSYDLDIAGSTPATGGHKSIELAVGYTGFIFKKPKPKPVIYCPRL